MREIKRYRIILCVVLSIGCLAGCNKLDDTKEKQSESSTDAVTAEKVSDTEEMLFEPAMYSDLDHLLSIGDTGRLNALSPEYMMISTTITPEELYTGEEAEQIIREYCRSGEANYEYSEPGDGYIWQMIRYRTSKSPQELYVNIKVEGLDGNKLVYEGTEVSSRTHDIFNKMKKTDQGYDDLYCYYEIPEGCSEYMLECGNRTLDTSETACYKITR